MLGAAAVVIVNDGAGVTDSEIMTMPSNGGSDDREEEATFTVPVVMIAKAGGRRIAETLKRLPLHARFEIF